MRVHGSHSLWSICHCLFQLASIGERSLLVTSGGRVVLSSVVGYNMHIVGGAMDVVVRGDMMFGVMTGLSLHDTLPSDHSEVVDSSSDDEESQDSQNPPQPGEARIVIILFLGGGTSAICVATFTGLTALEVVHLLSSLGGFLRGCWWCLLITKLGITGVVDSTTNGSGIVHEARGSVIHFGLSSIKGRLDRFGLNIIGLVKLSSSNFTSERGGQQGRLDGGGES